jgi:hypothetical protein
LGVGVRLHEGATGNSREAVRLKGRLVASSSNSKYPKQEASTARPIPEDDDEAESRTGAIQKKLRNDPFALPVKKAKKKAREDVNPPTALEALAPIAPISHSEEVGAGYPRDGVVKQSKALGCGSGAPQHASSCEQTIDEGTFRIALR